jgi:hypothetical protein
MPISTGWPDWSWKLAPGPLDPARRAPAPAGGLGLEQAGDLARGPEGGGDDAEVAGVDAAAGAEPLAAAQLVGVVGDQDQVGRGVLGAVGAGEAQVERGGLGAEHGGQQLEGGADLAVPVGGGLDDLGVQPGGGVVDEHPLADQAEVDAPLHRRPEGVKGAGHVPAVEAEVHGQVVAGAGGHAHEPDAAGRGHPGDQRLRAVPPGHPDHVGPAGHGPLGQLAQVVPGG